MLNIFAFLTSTIIGFLLLDGHVRPQECLAQHLCLCHAVYHTADTPILLFANPFYLSDCRFLSSHNTNTFGWYTLQNNTTAYWHYNEVLFMINYKLMFNWCQSFSNRIIPQICVYSSRYPITTSKCHISYFTCNIILGFLISTDRHNINL